ncbi:MAG: homoserine dehydrogenase [Candidatus Nanopelagicaceae bacterium]
MGVVNRVKEAKIGVGLLGCGTVGSEVAHLLKRDQADLSARAGASLELVKVGVKDAGKERAGIDKVLITADLVSIVTDPSISIVIEVMGGIEPARTLILQALAAKKSVVTANKALLAKHGAEIFAAAKANGVDLYYEAAVGGAIPIVRPLRESIVGDSVTRVMGIVNGTTNYILTKMDEEGAAYHDVLKEAQRLGYAEADPTADVEGHDAAAKIAILASLAFHTQVSIDDVHAEGIARLDKRDIEIAQAIDHVIKLLAIAEVNEDANGKQQVSVRVHPTLIPRHHPLASVRNAFNAVFVEAKSAGELMFYGRGAGGAPTASAILGDLVAIARHISFGGVGSRESDYAALEIASIDEIKTRYLIRLDVADRPGVLAGVAQTFAAHGVSIQTVRQSGRGDDAELVIMTHTATDKNLATTVKDLAGQEIVKSVESVLRVEGNEVESNEVEGHESEGSRA